MKKQILIALIGSALAAPFAVQAEGFYVGGNVGRAEQKSNFDGKDSDTAFKLLGGMAFDKMFGGELGYVDLGKATGDSGDTSKARAIYVAATGTFPLNQEFSLNAKVGASANRVKAQEPGFSDTFSRTSLLLGVGATYNFAPNLAAVVEYENFGKIYKEQRGHIKADLVSVGIRYKF